ncbi:unnamed protein product, partial [Ectocarpus sp. 12 AP-2014]
QLRSERELHLSTAKSPEATPEAAAQRLVVVEGNEPSKVSSTTTMGREGADAKNATGPVRDEAAEEAMREANQDLQMKLTMSIARLRRVKEDLRLTTE